MNKTAVARRFSQAAATYNSAAQVQREMAIRLSAMLPPPADLPAGGILELGCGTGLLTRMLTDSYPARCVVAIDLAEGMVEYCSRVFNGIGAVRFETADAEKYSPSDRPALVASNCAFQWFENPAGLLERIYSWLPAGGVLAIGTLLPDSLPELKASYEAASGNPLGGIAPWDELEWKSGLKGANWGSVQYVTASICNYYSDPLEVLRAIKSIGAGPLNDERAPLIAGETRKLIEHYRCNYSEPGSAKVRATYSALFILARRPV